MKKTRKERQSLIKPLKWHLYGILRKFFVRSYVDWKKHKVVVFESDDWGLCGNMRDAVAKEELINKGYDVSGIEFKDTLETVSELENLYKILESHKDKLGRKAVFTPNYVVSNPDYDKIRKNGFKIYAAIPITKGFSQHWNDRNQRGDLLAKWREGIKRHVWCPEYHGLFHINTHSWLRRLREGDKKLIDFFDEQMFTYLTGTPYDLRSEFASASHSWQIPISVQQQFISEGKEIFYNAFGYYPHTAIAPHYLWDEYTEVALHNKGIKYIQALPYHQARFPHNMHYHFLGEKNRNVVYLIRLINLEFQGGRNPQWDCIHAFEKIATAWKCGLPAIVSTHRLNYVGSIDPNMHSSGIHQLDCLLKNLENDFGDEVVYLSDFELAQLLDVGYSIQRYGDDEYICRNYVRNHTQKFSISIPQNWKNYEIINLNSGAVMKSEKNVRKSSTVIRFLVNEGDYIIHRIE